MGKEADPVRERLDRLRPAPTWARTPSRQRSHADPPWPPASCGASCPREAGPDVVAELPELDRRAPPVSQPGDVWQLGRHRLLCGSALEPAAYQQLPYFTRMLRLGFLAPAVVTAIRQGRQPPELNGKQLSLHIRPPIGWTDQIAALGI